MQIDYWIAHSDSFLHQIFMIVMGVLYAIANLSRVSYEAINIYFYYFFFPLSFALFLKTSWKYLFFPISLLFFLIPNFEASSKTIFQFSVDFLNWTAEIFNSNYIAMSVYICVLVPVLLYLPFLVFRLSRKQLKYLGLAFGSSLVLYFLLVYPFFKDFLLYVQERIADISKYDFTLDISKNTLIS